MITIIIIITVPIVYTTTAGIFNAFIAIVCIGGAVYDYY